LIDLHCHTFESDGSDAPQALLERAQGLGIHSLAITDHDTFAGYDAAAPFAEKLGIRLIEGVEISTKARNRSVHILAYWFGRRPAAEFLKWLEGMREIRRERNRRLAEQLRSLGVDIHLEEAEALGRTVTGRVHFAKVLVAKGHAANVNQAFERWIGEEAPGFVLMEDPKSAAAVEKVREFGGVPVLAHPIRLSMRDRELEAAFVAELASAGLLGLEVMHSDHNREAQEHYRQLADHFGLAYSGGSDYHGSVKPQVQLGSGIGGNVAVPQDWLDGLAELGARSL
jgi:3',5'-nucleoside bisphosphate phosphatase